MGTDSYDRISQITSFAFIPYLIIVIFTIPYFIHQKLLILRKIRNVPRSTIFQTDLSKVKKNLQIQSMVYNFILIIYSFEAIICLTCSVSNIYYGFWSPSSIYFVKVTNIYTNKTCHLWTNKIKGMYLDYSGYQVVLLPIIPNLFMIVLRRAYLNAPYKRWIKGYSLYFMFRLVSLILSTYFIITCYIEMSIQLPFLAFDFYTYAISSRKFYLLLRSMHEEAKSHSTLIDYKKKRMATKVFALTQIPIFFTVTILMIMVIMKSLFNITTLIQYGNCILQYMLPNTPINFTIHRNLHHVLQIVEFYTQTIQMSGNVIVGVMILIANLGILVWIILKLNSRRKAFKNINELTRPLIQSRTELVWNIIGLIEGLRLFRQLDLIMLTK